MGKAAKGNKGSKGAKAKVGKKQKAKKTYPRTCEHTGCSHSSKTQPLYSLHHVACDERPIKLDPIPCGKCRKVFPTHRKWLVHQRCHAPKNIACGLPGCSYVTNRDDSMSTHRRMTHSPLKPFACGVGGCPSRFKKRGGLNVHLRDFHPGGQ